MPGIVPISISRYYRSGDTNLGAFGRSTYFEYDWWLGGYDANGNINNTNPTMFLLVKPGNYQFQFAIQPDGTFTNSVNPAMSGSVITKNGDNTKTLRMKDGMVYLFNSFGELVRITDRNGNGITINRVDMNNGYNEGGHITSITTTDGKTVTFNQTYGNYFFKTNSIVDSAGRTVSYTYETDPFSTYPRLKTVTYPDGGTVQYQYDSSGRMSGFINERGVLEVLNVYDSNNRVITQTHADGGQYTFNYTVAGGYITQTDMTSPNGAVTTWRFNNYGYITEKTTPDGTTTYELEPGTNRILSITDPLGRHMTYIYDAKGRVTAVTDNANNTTSYEYEDANSRVTKITDAMGNQTNMTYDTHGNMLTQTTPDNKTTTFTYNAAGKPLTVTDAANNATNMQYDASGNLTQVTDPLGNTSQMAYDGLGRMITSTDAKGKSTNYEYDTAGRISSVTDALENITRYSYNMDGKLTQVTDAKGHIISYEYDNRDRMTKMTDQLWNRETYTYDTNDNLVSVTDRKGQTTTYTYDLMNRMTRVDYQDGSYTDYIYDAGGRLTTINDSISGTISYTYTGSGCGSGCGSMPDKIASETTPRGNISYAYDAIGRRTSMTVAGQPAVNYSYDAGGRLEGINTLINGVSSDFSFGYDNLGRRSSLSLPNGITTHYTYDNDSHLLNMEHKDSSNQTLESVAYTYDQIGNRIGMTRPSVSLPLRDAVSNTSYNNANQMLSFTDKNITYDANGNMTSVTNSCGTTTYSWNARNRLVGISGFKPDCSALTASFVYDASGRRIQKTINGRTIKYFYDDVDIIQEIENDLPTVNYIRSRGIDEPFARILSNGTVRYYQQDALGSVIALTDETGVIKTQYSYGPFGNVTISGEPSDNPFQYTGRENDGTGLYYYRARYYSPELQRFISADPIGLAGGDLNYYVYVGNNSVRHRDPHGLINPTIPGYYDCLRKIAPRIFCRMLRDRCKYAEEQNEDCRAITGENCWDTKDCPTWLSWCKRLGYL